MKFHHIGHASRNLETSAQVLTSLGYTAESPIIVDSLLEVRLQFWVGTESPRIELLEPIAGAGPLAPILRSRAGAYHYAFIFDSQDVAEKWTQASRMRPISSPMPAVAFPEHTVQFMGWPDGSLFEVIVNGGISS